MKFLSIIAVFLLLISNITIAQEDSLEGNAGVTPDSLLFGLDKALERIEIAFTFGEANKAKARLKHARERLLEVRELVKEKRLDAAERAKEEHKAILEEVRSRVDKVKEEDPETGLEEELELEERLEEHKDDIDKLDQEIELKGNLSEEQLQKVRELVASFKENSDNVRLKIKASNEELKVKIKTKEGKSDEEVNKLVEEKKEKFEEQKRERFENTISRVERFIENREEAVNKAKERGVDTAEMEKKIVAAKELLDEAKTLYEEGNFDGLGEVFDEIKDLLRVEGEIGRENAADKINEIRARLEEKGVASKAVERLEEVEAKLRSGNFSEIKKRIMEREENESEGTNKGREFRVERDNKGKIKPIVIDLSPGNSVNDEEEDSDEED